ncbi:hypothetical protein [Azorhizophilus paspali]|uniref:Uncharacterized protein n=1 Tax=Azorhizophilus paspali TaxID=69963 RepID=A0ABV6SKR7_AZOPA
MTHYPNLYWRFPLFKDEAERQRVYQYNNRYSPYSELISTDGAVRLWCRRVTADGAPVVEWPAQFTGECVGLRVSGTDRVAAKKFELDKPEGWSSGNECRLCGSPLAWEGSIISGKLKCPHCEG